MLYQNNNQKEILSKKNLLKKIEGFEEFCIYELDDDIYLFWGSMGSYIQYCIDNKKFSIVNQIFDLINTLLEKNKDIEFDNMIVVQVFEMLYDKKEYFELGYQHLNDYGKTLLLSIKENFRSFDL